MAEKKTAKKAAPKKQSELLPFDELPIVVKRNRNLLYEYIRTGELPNESSPFLLIIFFYYMVNNLCGLV